MNCSISTNTHDRIIVKNIQILGNIFSLTWLTSDRVNRVPTFARRRFIVKEDTRSSFKDWFDMFEDLLTLTFSGLRIDDDVERSNRRVCDQPIKSK